MSMELGWLLLALVLVIVELLTGTFFLLILGIAAGVGSLVAWLGGGFWLQALIASAMAISGTVLLIRRKKSTPGPARENQMDLGQTVVHTSWVSEAQRIARVRYRDADWDAEVLGTDKIEPGAVLFVAAVEGSRLKVSSSRSA
jgi:membrane protein implicated in regulation of membrane protease activity